MTGIPVHRWRAKGPPSGASAALRIGCASVLLGGAGALAIAAFTQRQAITRTSLFVSLLAPDSLFDRGLAALGPELEDDGALVAVRGGPLDLRRPDIERILGSAFDRADFQRKAGEAHSGIVRFIRAFPRDSVLRVSIEEERTAIAVNTGLYVRRRVEELPDCGLLTDVRTLFQGLRQKTLRSRTDEEFAAGLPLCRPPGPVKAALIRGVNRRLVEFAATGPDSVVLFRIPARDSAVAEWALTVKRADRALGWPPLLLLGVLAVLIPCLDGARRRGRATPHLWQPIAAGGITLALLGLVWIAAVDSLEPAAAVPLPGGSEASDSDRAWLALIGYALRAVLRTTGRWWLALGVLLAGTAALGWWLRARAERGHPAGAGPRAGAAAGAAACVGTTNETAEGANSGAANSGGRKAEGRARGPGPPLTRSRSRDAAPERRWR